jgi:tetratricopeptide (TPR) repeat protein
MKLSLSKLVVVFTFVLSITNLAFAQTEREKGVELYQNGDYEKATESLQKAVEADKKDYDAWLYLGMSLARLKKTSKAVDALNKADKISSKENVENKNGVKIVAKPRASYTDAARENQTQGIIALAVEFGADGTIKGVFPFQTLPNGLTENAIRVARKIKFEPATKDGKPIFAIRIIKYSFTIY